MATDEPGKTIRLVCKISHSVDEKGYSPTSGDNLLTVTFLDEGKATIRKQGLGAQFVASISKEMIVGHTIWGGDLQVKESISINRFTGSFENNIQAKGKAGLIFFGTCSLASRQLF